MAETDSANGIEEMGFEAFGVRLAVEVRPPELADRVRSLFPPGWQPCAPADADQRLALLAENPGTYTLTIDGDVLNSGLGIELALAMIESQIRLHVGVKSTEAVFVHAGVVAHRGYAIVAPGSSFAGKTTLVAALVRAGAVYFSDEFAVIDAEGGIHPYAKPLSIRGDDYRQVDHEVDALGGVAGDASLPLGLLVATSYRPDAEWRPVRLSAGEGAMELLAHALPARERPAQVMKAVSVAAEGAVILRSDRGEAESLAPLLLAEVDRISEHDNTSP